MTTLPATQSTTSIGLNYEDSELLLTIRQTIAPDATDAEFKVFIEFAKGTRLNPFKKEIWFIKTPEKRFYSQREGKEIFVPAKVQIMTGINGFWTIANNHPLYDGSESGWINGEGELVKVALPGKPCLGAWIRVYRKDRKMPHEAVVYMAEYNKGESRWKAAPLQMILKVAESVGLRKAFPTELNGLYTAEEMPQEFAAPGKPPMVVAEVQEAEQAATVALPAPSEAKVVEQPKVPFQEDAPDWMGLAKVVRYDLSSMSSQSRKVWEGKLEDHGCKKVNGIWEAPAAIQKLAKYEVIPPSGEEESRKVLEELKARKAAGENLLALLPTAADIKQPKSKKETK